MTGSGKLFELAVVLIPALLLGGAVLDVLKGGDHRAPGLRWMAFVTVVFAVFAELTAIRAIVDGDPSDFDRIVVVLSLGFGTGLAGLALVWPMLPSFIRGRRFAALLASVLLLGSVSLYESVVVGDVRQSDRRFNELAVKVRRADEAIMAAYARIDEARKDLARSERHPGRRGRLESRLAASRLGYETSRLGLLVSESNRLTEELVRSRRFGGW